MTSLEYWVNHLAGIRITDRNRIRAYDVARYLLASVLKERWHELSEHQQQTRIIESGNRLWNGYMKNRRNEVVKPDEAARYAIFDEITFLEQPSNPNNAKLGLLEQGGLS